MFPVIHLSNTMRHTNLLYYQRDISVIVMRWKSMDNKHLLLWVWQLYDENFRWVVSWCMMLFERLQCTIIGPCVSKQLFHKKILLRLSLVKCFEIMSDFLQLSSFLWIGNCSWKSKKCVYHLKIFKAFVRSFLYIYFYCYFNLSFSRCFKKYYFSVFIV